jgi:hypothetical protein
MFDKISFWWQTDPKAKQKLFFGVVTILILILLIILLIVNNKPKKQTEIDPNSNLPEFLRNPKATKVDISNLNSNKFRQVLNTPVLADQVLINEEDLNRPIFLNQDFRLQIGNEIALQSPKLITNQIHKVGDNVILNQSSSSLLYNLKEKKFKSFGNDVINITPFENKFLFVTKVRENYFIKVTDNLELKNTKVLGTISPSINAQATEIRIFRGSPYLLVFDNFNHLDTMEIWNLSQGKTQKIQTLQKIRSLSFGKDKIMYTTSLDEPTLLTNYSNQMLDFSTNQNGIVVDLPISSKIVKDEIFGTVAAHRCQFQENSDNIYCLVKQKKVPISDPTEKDILLIFNYKNNQAFYPYSQESISGSRVYLSNSGRKFFVASENNLLYEIL